MMKSQIPSTLPDRQAGKYQGNPKFEIRNTKQALNHKSQYSKQALFSISNLEFVYDLDISI